MARQPQVSTIAAGRPFLDTLAAGLLHRTDDSPDGLAEYLILLPTRRACRALADAFLRVGHGRALILPSIRPLGDVDEESLALSFAAGADDLDLPPEIPDLRRRLLLARLVLGWKERSEDIAPDQALRLAGELARLLDQIQTEQLNFTELSSLAPSEFASHWQDTVEFLKIVTEHWPTVLDAEGCLDPADRRNRMIRTLAEQWRTERPATPVIAAGSTGSIPATAELLQTVAGLPAGHVILPGLDRVLDSRALAEAGEDPAHPQFGMLRLLKRLGVTPQDVGDWDAGPEAPPPTCPAERIDLAAEALRPAATTDAWRSLGPVTGAAVAGIERIDCANEAEEAGAVALILRHVLEQGGRSAALVTPDRQIARRVAAELSRWHIDVDDSAGRRLGDTPTGEFLRLIARAIAQELSPVALLALLKHPLAAGRMEPVDMRRCAREMEIALLRGVRPAPGIAGLRALIEAQGTAGTGRIGRLLDAVEGCLGDLPAMMRGRHPLEKLIDVHVTAAEALAATDRESGDGRLWQGEDGEALANAVSEMRLAADAMDEIDGADYAPLFETMLAGLVVRPRYGRHPRLHIWGPLEARLLSADLVVLAGLNEGTWPADPGDDPWMSRPMRAKFGLPPPERRIGLAAHDFAQLLAAPRVALVRAARVEGAPTVPSRWLTRLDTVLQAAGHGNALTPSLPWRSLYHALSRPDRFERVSPPAPRPPLESRPRHLSVTRVETWMRDPYAIYAERILSLKALDPLEADPGAADRGMFVHDALDQFMRENKGELPPDAFERLVRCGRAAFGDALTRPAVRAFWWPRFLRIARWFLVQESERRPRVLESATEVRGLLELAGPAGPFVLTATADRIDRIDGDGSAIIDYKTGLPPSERQVDLGYAPQLPLEAAILAEGGFEGVAPDTASELAYWRLSGGDPAGEIRRIKGNPEDLAAEARAGLLALIAAFDDPATPYMPTPRPDWAPSWNDYQHLARTKEWSAGTEGDEA